eukprot:6213807-Pleurochrysis_carterae.AAC.4
MAAPAQPPMVFTGSHRWRCGSDGCDALGVAADTRIYERVVHRSGAATSNGGKRRQRPRGRMRADGGDFFCMLGGGEAAEQLSPARGGLA